MTRAPEGSQLADPQNAVGRRCAYCDGMGKLTREEIFSTFLQRHYRDYGTYVDHKRRKVVRSAPKVKDVCRRCNNQLLSGLDGYAAQLNRKYFQVPPSTIKRLDFQYDYGRLVRWLLKVWYNDARSQHLDIEVHRAFVPFILGQQANPPYALSLLAGTLAPFRLPRASLDDEPQVPQEFGIARFTIAHPEMRQSLLLARMMNLNSYVFQMLVWKPGSPRPTRHRLIGGMKSKHGLALLPAHTTRVLLPTLKWETLDYLLAGSGWISPEVASRHASSRALG